MKQIDLLLQNLDSLQGLSLFGIKQQGDQELPQIENETNDTPFKTSSWQE